jgi:hypothetical protein
MAIEGEVKTTVSPTLHPANITGLDGYEATKGYIAEAVTSMDAAHQSVAAVIEARQKLNLDQSRTPRAKVLMTAQLADKYSAKLQAQFESSWGRLDKAIAHTEGDLSQPLQQQAGAGSVNGEIRTHTKALSRDERVKLLTAAIGSGDITTAGAILGAPPYLSGLSDIEHTHFTRQYHEATNPEVAQRLKVMKGALDKLQRAHPALIQELEKAVGASRRDVERLQAATSEAEAALVMKEFNPVSG